QANSTNCPSVGTCVSDNIAPILTFNVVGNTITVTSTYGIGANVSANSVWGDFSPSFGGLGAGTGQGTLHHNTDDQLNGYETLHIHFATAVSFTGVATLFADGHTTFGTAGFFPDGASISDQNTFLFSTNGSTFSPVTFAAANSGPFASVFGNDFYFRETGAA